MYEADGAYVLRLGKNTVVAYTAFCHMIDYIVFQIKSIYLDKQIQKNVDKMSNEMAWGRARRAARASYMDPPKKKKKQTNKTTQ